MESPHIPNKTEPERVGRKSTPTMIDFVGRGYLPPSLPPIFTTMNLAEVAPDLVTAIVKFQAEVELKALANKNGKKLPTVWTTPMTVSFPTKQGKRRTATIPNPYSHLILCDKILQGWDLVARHCNKSKISFSRLHMVGAERSLSFRDTGPEVRWGRMSFPLSSRLAQKRLELSSHKKHVLRLDVSTFYPSIYTHALSWALGGKDYSKRKIRGEKLDPNPGYDLGDSLDKAVQCSASGQTKGIPIGPDTSRVLSEIIGASVDLALIGKLKAQEIELCGIRYVDDFLLYFDDAHAMESAKAVLADALSEFELEINHSKTDFGLACAEPIEAPWVRPIREYRIRGGAREQRNDIYGLVDLITMQAKKYPSDSVALYGAKVLTSLRVRFGSLRQVIPAVWRLVQLDSRVIQVAATFTAQLWPSLQSESGQKCRELIYASIEFHLDVFLINRWEIEVCWLLWLVLLMKHRLAKRLQTKLVSSKHPLVVLCLLELNDAKLIPELDLSDLESELEMPEALKDASWMLAYELFRRGLVDYPTSEDSSLTDKSVVRRVLKFFENLKQGGISFISKASYSLDNTSLNTSDPA